MRLAKALLELVILALLSHSLVDFSSPVAGNEGLLQYTLVAALARRGHLGIHARAYRRANNPSFALFRSRAGLREADSLSDATSSVGSLRESFESAAAFLLQLQRLLRRLAACWQRRARQTGLRLRGLSHPIRQWMPCQLPHIVQHQISRYRTIECLPQCGCRSSVVLRGL